MSKHIVHITRTDFVNVAIEAETREQAEEIAFKRFADGEIEFPPVYNYDNIEITADTAAQELSKPAPVTFTPDELYLLSNALILAIQENSEAMKHITSGKAKAALNGHIDVLSYLNTKVCNMMKEV